MILLCKKITTLGGLKEMKENPYVFYSAIFNDDEDDDSDYHDEFR